LSVGHVEHCTIFETVELGSAVRAQKDRICECLARFATGAVGHRDDFVGQLRRSQLPLFDSPMDLVALFL